MNTWLTIALIIFFFGTLVSWVLCSARHRYVDTSPTRDCRNLCSRLAINWQKAMEITNPNLFFLLKIIQIILEKWI